MSNRRKSRRLHNFRVVLLAACALVAYGGLSARLAQLTLARGGGYLERAENQHRRLVQLTPRRGEILDRDGRPLALSVDAHTLVVRPGLLREGEKQAIAAALAVALDVPPDRYLRRMETGDRVIVARRLEPDVAEHVASVIAELDLPSTDHAYFDQETSRLYPMNTVASAIIGHTQPDETGMNLGVSGVEFAFNDHLRGRPASSEVLANSIAQRLEPLRPEALIASAGHRVHLTIDSVIQREAEDALMDAINAYQADWGTCVVLDARTAEVLAMANAPVFDANSYAQSPDLWRRNHAMRVPVDMGSVMKIFTFAGALEDGLFTEDELIDCHQGHWSHPLWRGVRVTDDASHRLGLVPFHEAFALSSNIATVRLTRRFAPTLDPSSDRQALIQAERTGAARLVSHLSNFGFGRRTGIELGGEAPGSLLPAGEWSAPSFTTIPIGQGVTVTALQTAAALTAIANGGVWQTPTIVRRVEDAAGQEVTWEREIAERRVISDLTAQRMLRLMEEVVNEGTGTDAQIPGYRVGGKTGTADRMDEQTGQYVSRTYVPTFAGVAPVDDPDVVCVVFVSNPDRRIGFYGGDVAAPVFQRVVSSALRLRGMTPQRTTQIAAPIPSRLIEQAHADAGEQREAGGENQMDMNLPTLPSGFMPQLHGATMREVVEAMQGTGAVMRFEGTGRVTDQTPEPGQRIDSASRVLVIFQEDPAAPAAAERVGG